MFLTGAASIENIPSFVPDTAGDLVHAIIETPRDTPAKYAFDHKCALFRQTELLADGLEWPFDYGFIPGTLADDGDPLDILNLSTAGTFPGCLVRCRVLGIVRLEKDGVRNDRVLAAPIRFRGAAQPTDSYEDADDIPSATVDGLIRFLVEYSAQQGHQIKCKGLKSKDKALSAIRRAVEKRRSHR